TTQLLRRSIRYAIERSQILRQLRNSERAMLEALNKERELNQLKSYFVSMVSHEFRNPLSALRMMSDLLLHFEERLTPEKKESFSQQIRLTIDHMCQLLDEVILLGKVDTGNFQIELKLLDLTEYCKTLIASHQYSDDNRHPIVLHCQPGLTPLALDANLLGHILNNLISNALKYSLPSGEVHIEVSQQHDTVTFSITDRGIGIPAEDQPRLFDAFTRCRNVGKIQGTGLGLAIVKRCVDLHQGKVSVESALGLGTKVTVILPIGSALTNPEAAQLPFSIPHQLGD
ncbi:MAG TPA: HAMP domain-containing sensor histidine kinase, partial [Allocoleopsis sp.]